MSYTMKKPNELSVGDRLVTFHDHKALGFNASDTVVSIEYLGGGWYLVTSQINHNDSSTKYSETVNLSTRYQVID